MAFGDRGFPLGHPPFFAFSRTAFVFLSLLADPPRFPMIEAALLIASLLWCIPRNTTGRPHASVASVLTGGMCDAVALLCACPFLFPPARVGCAPPGVALADNGEVGLNGDRVAIARRIADSGVADQRRHVGCIRVDAAI